MRQIILNVNDTNDLVDDAGVLIYTGFDTFGFIFQEHVEESTEVKESNPTLHLVAMGKSTDDILKLKAANLI